MRTRFRHACRGRYWVIGLLLLASVSLLACGRPSHPSQAAKRPAPIVLELWTLQLMTFADVIRPMLDGFERAHPGVRVQWTDVPFNEGEKRALTAILGPNVPDVINLNPDFSAILAARGALYNVADLTTTSQRSALLPVAWQAVTLEPSLLVGVPWYITSRVTLYNRSLLARAGWHSPPRTMAELLTFARDLKHHAPQAYALMPHLTASGNFLKELQKHGVPLYDTQGRAVFADHQEAAALLAQWRTLLAERLVPPESLTEGPQAAVDRYQSGALALLMTGPNFLTTIRENAPALYAQTDVAPQFPQNAALSDFSTMILVIPKRSRHPRLAAELALWLTHARNQLALCDRAPVLPSAVAALHDERFQHPHARDLAVRARSISAGQLLTARQAYRIRPQQKALGEVMDWRVQQALLGTIEPAAAMKQAQIAMNDVLKGR